MARRPDFTDNPLTVEELLHLKKKLARMSLAEVRDFYRMTLLKCNLTPGRVPKARAIQELVAAWKHMRTWDKR